MASFYPPFNSRRLLHHENLFYYTPDFTKENPPAAKMQQGDTIYSGAKSIH
jgi:hypothetical protein